MDDPRKKSRHQQAIELMMAKADQELPQSPVVPDEKVRILRARLILEEALEFCEASGLQVVHGSTETGFIVRFDDLVFVPHAQPDIVEMGDGLGDLSVVTIGSLSAMGIADEPLLEEVDTNNLAKFEEQGPCGYCGGTGEEGMDLPIPRRDCICKGRVGSDGKTTLGGYRDEHGKWIKPLNHPKPDIAGVLSHQQYEVDPEPV